MPVWVQTGYDEYAKRLPKNFQLSLVEVARRAEAERILGRVGPTDTLVVLDETGTGLSTVKFAGKLKTWQEAGANPTFVVGGADGLDPSCLERANFRLSLSSFTLPHGMVRVMLAEQIYRAWSLLNNHPYHRA
ncbi:UNVERIFIED_CONTAM: hypothetical protein GTU68_014134 [Idotea baltica]|nr:hypothetical protein [Idotea baltica]